MIDILNETEAVVRFENNNFIIIKKGGFVRCSVTKQKIPIDRLLYWNHEVQEAYASPEIAKKRFIELKNI